MVIYFGLEDKTYHATLNSFLEKVEHNGQLVPRFELVKELESPLELMENKLNTSLDK